MLIIGFLAVFAFNSADSAIITAPVIVDFYVQNDNLILDTDVLYTDTNGTNALLNRTYMVFDISSLYGEGIVTNATLNLFYDAGPGNMYANPPYQLADRKDYILNIYQADLTKYSGFNDPGFDTSNQIGSFQGIMTGTQWLSTSLNISNWDTLLAQGGVLTLAIQNDTNHLSSFSNFSSSDNSIVSNRPSFVITAVPEPSSIILISIGLVGLIIAKMKLWYVDSTQ
jgi:hypothetical protein